MNRAFQQIEAQAGNAFQRVGGKIQTAGDKIYSVGASLTRWTAPLAAIGVYGIKTFGDFDAILAEIQARTGATADEMDAVSAKAQEMGKTTSFSSTQAAEAMLQLLASGYDLEQTFTALPAVLNAAAAGGMDLGFTADVVTDVLAMWQLEASEATRVTDALARASAASSAEMPDLAQGLGNVGPIAAKFGLSVEDTVAILSAFSERGIKGAEAGTQLKSMLTNMTRPTDKVTAAWKKLGISMYDAQGNIRPLTQVLAEMRPALEAMSDQERNETVQTLAGSYGQLGLTVLTAEPAMEDMLKLMAGQADAATVAAARLNSLPGVIGMLKSSIDTLLIETLGPSIETGLKPMIRHATEMINKLMEWVQANPELTAKIVEFLAVLVATGPVLMGLGKSIKLIGTLITGLGSPIGIITLAIAAFYLAYQTNFLGIRDLVDKFVDWFTEKAMPVIRDFVLNDLIPALDKLYTWFKEDALPAIIAFIEDPALPAVEDLIHTLKDVWDAVQPKLADLADWWLTTGLPNVVNFIRDVGIPGVELLIDTLKDVWDKVKPKLTSLFDWFQTTGMPNVINFIKNVVIPGINLLRDALKDIWDKTQAKLQSFVNFVNNQIGALKTSVFDPIKDAINNVIDAIGNLTGPLESIGDALPDWLIPGSPTPFERGLRGIKDAMDAISAGGFDLGMTSTLALAGGPSRAMQPAGGLGSMQVIIQLPDSAARDPEKAYDAGRAAGRGFKDELQSARRWQGGGVISG